LGARNGPGRLGPKVELRSGKAGKNERYARPVAHPRLGRDPGGRAELALSRSSGPGGQSVNTIDSRVELSFDVAASAALGPLKTRALQRLAGRLANGVTPANNESTVIG
jgi:hypothetical protein